MDNYNENDFADIVAVLKEERETSAPKYINLAESIVGEASRISEMKLEQVNDLEKGGIK